MAKMSNDQFCTASTYVQECAYLLGISPEWSVDLSADLIPVSEGFAMTYVDTLHKTASMVLSDWLLTARPEFVRDTVAHELTHARLGEYSNHVDNLDLSKSDRDRAGVLLEQACDSIGRMVAGLLPLPSKEISGDSTLADFRLLSVEGTQ